MRSAALLVFAAAAVACFNPTAPPPLDTDSSTGGSTGTTPTTSASTGGGTPTSSSATTTATEPTSESSEGTGTETETAGAPVCGDGVQQDPEVCDDGDTSDGDGCASTCLPEDGWECDGASPTICVAPDLTVRVVAAAFVAQGLQLTYVVTNNGGLESGPYRVDLWDTRTGGFANPPSAGDDGVVTFADKPSLVAGGMQMFNDTIPSPVNGTHVAFAVVDSAGEIILKSQQQEGLLQSQPDASLAATAQSARMARLGLFGGDAATAGQLFEDSGASDSELNQPFG